VGREDEEHGTPEHGDRTGDGGRSLHTAPVTIRISPMAHLGVAIVALGMVPLVGAVPILAPLWLIPVLLSVAIVRYRTVADRAGVMVRTLVGNRTLPWDTSEGLRFGRGSWAIAHCRDGGQVRLPAVTFATLPLLTEASGGRVPNPYDRD
jgi:hypothetical protein